MFGRFGVVGLAVGALVLTACGRGLAPIEDGDTEADTTVDVDSDTRPERDTEGTDDPGTDDPGTDDPGTDDPGTDDPGTDDPGTDDPGTDDPGTDDPGTDDPGTDACIPDCDGQVCGDDGCGGSCGTCDTGSECSASGDECLTTSTPCRPVQLADNLEAFALNAYFTQDISGTGELQAQFYTDDTGTFFLDSGINRNFADCEQCLLYFEDGGDTLYYQTAGALIVADNPQDGDVAITLSGVELVESTINDTTLVSTPVPGGECIEIAGPLTLESPEAVVSECDAMELTTLWGMAAPDIDGWFFASVDPSPFTGATAAEIYLETYSDATGTFDLATGVNGNYETCVQCVSVFAADLNNENDPGRSYYATGGTLTISSAMPTGRSLTATINDLTLEEVTIDTDTFRSTPVADGQCLSAPPSITISVPAP